MTKELIYRILSALNENMNIPDDYFGLEKSKALKLLVQIQNEGFISDAKFAHGGRGNPPLVYWLEDAYITMKGLNFIEEYEKSAYEPSSNINLSQEFVSACAKIADNIVSYASFDEDALNREVRNLLDSAITRWGYTITDQTQQGFGISGNRVGELDIRINKNGIPVAIYEGLIHSTKQVLHEHIGKSIFRYNQSGCEAVYVVEFSKNDDYDRFWKNATANVREYSSLKRVEEENTGLMGVRMLKGIFEWEKREGCFYYLGVNCHEISNS